MNMTDGELLRHYVRDKSETAFSELVGRHINLVYSAALRQVNQDAHLAEDITQSVFTDLARKAARLLSHTSLTGWLYTSTRYVAANIRRTERRRTIREQEAHAMNALLSQPDSQPDWSLLGPLLDDAMHKLDDAEREAVLLRHFEKRSYAEIGLRFGTTENAARMRVDRALEKLHNVLTRQGVTLAVVALTGLLASNAVMAAPQGLAVRVVTGALAGAATGGVVATLAAGIAHLLKTKLAMAASAVVLAGAMTAIYETHHKETIRGSHANPEPVVLAANLPVIIGNTNVPVANKPAANIPKARKRDVLNLHLKFVTADGGKPIPNMPVEYRGWAGEKFKGKHFIADRFGECDVDYPTNISELELTSQLNGFADTQLLWHPQKGELIPTNYLVKIDWPVAIGGKVVDADGNPVPGAKVGWNNQDDPASLIVPQNHRFGWIETTTGEDGTWRINRIAEDMIPLIYGSARHSNYVGSALIFAGQDKTMEKQLRESTHVFRLGRTVVLVGNVVDTNGQPVPDAKVMVGFVSNSDSRATKTSADGGFVIHGCPPGRQLVTAVANGFAPVTVTVNLAENPGPVQVKLTEGKVLRLRVLDAFGNPIPKASLWYDCINGFNPDSKDAPVQLDFSPTTDRDGRVMLANAPDAEMTFNASASGFLHVNDIKIHPDGEEHIITLQNALVVHGVVYDEVTGERIPKFRIAQGWPSFNPVEGATNIEWSPIGRFWLDFSGGTYSNTFEEAVISGEKNPGYVLKFISDGYRPFISRVIGANEGSVELNVTLRRATTTTVTVYKPNGQPAAYADIGMASPGARLQFANGAFSRRNVQSGGSLLRTDANGTFTLQPDDTVAKVIAVNSDGYGEAVPSALQSSPTIQLQPWGHLEAMCYSAGKPVSGREYGLAFRDVPADSVGFDFDVSRVTSDAGGKISVDMLPPGNLELVRHYPVHNGWMNGQKTPFEIKPGETTTLTLGMSNYTVTAHLVWPNGIQRQAQWQISAAVHTPVPPIPPEILTNQAALKEFVESDEFKSSRKDVKSYPATINDDDTISTEDVVAGDYDLSVSVITTADPGNSKNAPAVANFREMAQGTAKLTVPVDPPFGTVDAGPIEMKLAPAP